ncbi:hypothetical protein A9Z42_0044130 [Trichoderma parareesei]|uniref:Uncharacterized protein n=1 Tax=Trichoderma parareesei TaxID=858221 RepID=A0A2H2YTT7_TRIPA|nr:hypothetical protein A9Z42_0044130 [Trichoderma parareesei]
MDTVTYNSKHDSFLSNEKQLEAGIISLYKAVLLYEITSLTTYWETSEAVTPDGRDMNLAFVVAAERAVLDARTPELLQISPDDEDSTVALAERAMMWILCSLEPLRTETLLEAVQYYVRGSSVVRGKQMTRQQIISSCHGILAINARYDVWTVSRSTAADCYESEDWTPGKLDLFASKVALGFLASSPQQNAECGPFASYVHRNWHRHVRRYDQWLDSEGREADPHLVVALKRFLGSPDESSDAYRAWVAAGDHELRHLHPSNMALFAICSYGFFHTLRDWWWNGSITDKMALMENLWGENSYALAAKGSYLNICRRLISLASAEIADARRQNRALLNAVDLDDFNLVKLLVMEGNADVNFAEDGRLSAAQQAALYHPEVLRWFLNQGVVDLERENGSGGLCYGNILIAAAAHGSIESVRMLLAAGANVNAAVQTGRYGSALVAAAHRYSHVDTQSPTIVRLILDHGADPNLAVNCGEYGSALVAAVAKAWKEGHERIYNEVLDMLLAAGADPAAVSGRGNHGNALAAAAFLGRKEMLKAMIKRVGKRNAIKTLRLSWHPIGQAFHLPDDIERRRHTATHLTVSLGVDQDVLHRIGLHEPDPDDYSTFGITVQRG